MCKHFFYLIYLICFSFFLYPSLLHLNFINKMSPSTTSFHCCVYFFFTPFLGPFFFSLVFIYRTLAPLCFLPSLIRFSLHYGVISVSVIQSEGQQKSLGAWNRLLSQAESTDTFSAGITLFHYWQSSFSPFLSLNLLIYPHLCLCIFYFSPSP